MTRLGPDFWTALECSPTGGEDILVRAPFPEICTTLLANVGPGRLRRFLVRLDWTELPIADSKSRGIAVRTEELIDQSGVASRYALIECREAAGEDLFNLIGEDLAFAIQEKGAHAGISRVLAKWRRFWGQLPKSLLTRDEQIGLFSELWFIAHWLLPGAGPMDCVARWRGPYHARHDFESQGLSVEVKGTTSVRSTLVHINGVDQLEPPTAGNLYLFVLRLREEGGAEHTLPGLVDDLRKMLDSDPDAVGLLDTGLIQAGYSPAHDSDYAQTKWRIVEQLLIPIDEDFARIRPSHFPSGLPPGVSALSYQLEIRSTPTTLKNPSDAAKLLR